MKRTTIIYTAVSVFSVAAIVLTIALLHKSTAQPIYADATFKQAQSLSKGSKQPCLKDVASAEAAVAKDDKIIDESSKTTSFDLAIGSVIIDVPAGTNFNTTVNNYDGKTVSGTLTYDGKYGGYNYTVKRLAGQGEWQFVAMTACEK